MKIIGKKNSGDPIVVDIECDVCGESCKKWEDVINNPLNPDFGEKWYQFEYMEMNATWGYDSGKDLEQWEAQICEKCIDEKFGFVNFQKQMYL